MSEQARAYAISADIILSLGLEDTSIIWSPSPT